MNCWKSCNIPKDYGSIRLLVLSILSALSFFVLFYNSYMDINHHVKLVSFNFVISIGSILVIFPLHTLLHCIPILGAGKKARLVFNNIKGIPTIYCNKPDAIPKWLSLFSVAFPLIVINLLTIVLALWFPQQMHYFSIVGAINFGLSMTDILYIALLLKAPAHSYIEDDQDRINILIRNHS